MSPTAPPVPPVPPEPPVAPVVVLVPVKPPAHGKSRLVGLSDDDRTDLAEAFALDTVAAALAAERVAQVLVVTDDARLALRVGALGVPAIPDGTSADLNEALRLAAAEVARRWPGAVAAALCADVPAVSAASLDAALALAEGPLAAGDPVFVADAAGTGTVLYAAAPERFAPRYGLDSCAAHEEAGVVRLEDDALAPLRQDVDDLRDLQAALRLGVGAHTRAMADRIGLARPR